MWTATSGERRRYDAFFCISAILGRLLWGSPSRYGHSYGWWLPITAIRVKQMAYTDPLRAVNLIRFTPLIFIITYFSRRLLTHGWHNSRTASMPLHAKVVQSAFDFLLSIPPVLFFFVKWKFAPSSSEGRTVIPWDVQKYPGLGRRASKKRSGSQGMRYSSPQ